MPVGVVTDSSCDLPAATLKRVGATAVPLQIQVGEESYLDGRDLDPGTFYDWIQHQGVEAQVRAAAVEDFMQVYRSSLRRFDSLISIHLSPHFSRTLRHASEAAERLGARERITLLDSGSAGAGLAEVVLEAARLAREGLPCEDVLASARAVSGSLYGVFCPTRGSWRHERELLGGLRERRHLAQGHRPLVAMEGGRLEPTGWTRELRVGQALAERVGKRFGDRPLRVTVAYAGSDPEALAGLRTAVESSSLNLAHGRMQLIGAAVGARLGAGAAALFARPELDAG